MECRRGFWGDVRSPALARARVLDWRPYFAQGYDGRAWCAFLLKGIRSQADENHQKVVDILALHERFKPLVMEQTRLQHGIKALDWVFHRPIFRITDFISESQIPEDTARRLLKVLERLEIVRVLVQRSGRKSSTPIFPEPLNIAEGKEAS